MDKGIQIDVRGDSAGLLTIASDTRAKPPHLFKIAGVLVILVAGAGLLLSLRQPQVESKAGLIGCFNELFSAHA